MALSPKILRRLILAALSTLILLEIVVLTPSPTEEPGSQAPGMKSENLIRDDAPSAIPNLPKRKIAEYGVNSFKYIAVQNGVKQWKLDATQAFMYNPEKLVHGRQIAAALFDLEGKATLVTGAEAKYYMNQKDLEIFGNVHTIFPDGFEIWSEYLRYRPNEHRATVADSYFVRGQGDQPDGQKLEFSSYGFDYQMDRGKVLLSKKAKVTLVKSAELDAQGVPNKTIIESDRCLMDRGIQVAYFTMDPAHSPEKNFVKIIQPTLFTRARRANLSYGDFSSVLKYIIASDEVLIQETGPEADGLRYATGGLAEFDTRSDRVVLSQFPQIYQDESTVTGDLITFHRDTGIIEIDQSNGFSQGNSAEKNKKRKE